MYQTQVVFSTHTIINFSERYSLHAAHHPSFLRRFTHHPSHIFLSPFPIRTAPIITHLSFPASPIFPSHLSLPNFPSPDPPYDRATFNHITPSSTLSCHFQPYRAVHQPYHATISTLKPLFCPSYLPFSPIAPPFHCKQPPDHTLLIHTEGPSPLIHPQRCIIHLTNITDSFSKSRTQRASGHTAYNCPRTDSASPLTTTRQTAACLATESLPRISSGH